MNFDLTDEQRQILLAIDTLAAAEYPLSRLHRPGADSLAPLADFGAFSLALPEDAGGAGLGAIDEALLHTRLGRHLVSPSALAAPVAAALARAQGDRALGAAIAEGRTRVAAGALAGDTLLLLDHGASHALWREAGQLHLAEVAPGQAETAAGGGPPLTRVPRPATNLSGPDLRWTLLVSAHLLGVAEGVRDLSVAYAQTRVQFGRPIGAFQAIKHQAANMALGTGMLSAQLDFAALALDRDAPDAAFQIAALARIAPAIALRNARLAIQMHGAMGFSAETDPHLFLKQAHRLGALIGGEDLLAMTAPLAPFDPHPL